MHTVFSPNTLVENPSKKQIVKIDTKNLPQFLGRHRYRLEYISQTDEVGVVNGLAWTRVGGEIMQIEAAVLDGTGKVVLTGSLGNVMKESAQAAISYIRSISKSLGIDGSFYKDKDIHIHATEGAVPKDGPSAGVTIATAVVSALTGRPVRRDVAMTGEITIRGRVLPIGGLREKTMAAYKSGIKTVIIPEENIKDLEEIDDKVKSSLKIVPVTSADAVFDIALKLALQSEEVSHMQPALKTKITAASSRR